jgi:hypothetical protein
MPLKDHKREIWCVTAVANLLRHRANEMQHEENEVARAAQELAENEVFLEKSGTEFGAW